jgi:uncharacterized membrane protein
VTHFCAPTFCLLAGVGVGIAAARGKTPRELSRFLVTRGLWLVLLEVTVSAWAWSFQLVPPLYAALVLWSLGWSMVCLAALVRLPRAAVAAFGLALVVGHNLLDGVAPESLGALAPLWRVLHVPGFLIPGRFLVAYPLVPWMGVMALGYVLGATVFAWEPAVRRRFLLRAGTAATVAFVVLRAINGYGDPAPWTTQRDAAMTVASFLNVRKYPPSLDFLLMTLGPALVALTYAERARGFARSVAARVLTVYGRVPLFYYLLHIVVAHVVAVGLALAQRGDAGFLFRGSFPPDGFPDWYGVGLPGVYAAWVLVVAVCYLPCRWFAAVKARRRDWWLSYL